MKRLDKHKIISNERRADLVHKLKNQKTRSCDGRCSAYSVRTHVSEKSNNKGRLLCGATVKVYDSEDGDETGAVGISFIWCRKGDWYD
jgi:hypothetical protein